MISIKIRTREIKYVKEIRKKVQRGQGRAFRDYRRQHFRIFGNREPVGKGSLSQTALSEFAVASVFTIF